MPTLVCTTSRTSIAKRWASSMRVGSDTSVDHVVGEVLLGAADVRRSISSQRRKSGVLADRETPPDAARRFRLVGREVGPRSHALILSEGSDKTIADRNRPEQAGTGRNRPA
jgi:hypothetical protein